MAARYMLRHATGYYLASKGQDTRAIQAYMGHKNIQHTVRYKELSPGMEDRGRWRFFWVFRDPPQLNYGQLPGRSDQRATFSRTGAGSA